MLAVLLITNNTGKVPRSPRLHGGEAASKAGVLRPVPWAAELLERNSLEQSGLGVPTLRVRRWWEVVCSCSSPSQEGSLRFLLASSHCWLAGWLSYLVTKTTAGVTRPIPRRHKLGCFWLSPHLVFGISLFEHANRERLFKRNLKDLFLKKWRVLPINLILDFFFS